MDQALRLVLDMLKPLISRYQGCKYVSTAKPPFFLCYKEKRG